MALTTPSSASEVIDRAINDVFLALQEFGAKPSLKNSWLNSLIVAYSNRVFDFYFALDQAALESLPDTATAASVGGNLERWAAIFGITRNAGRQSGPRPTTADASLFPARVSFTGTAASVVPIDTTLVAGDGREYTTLAAGTITAFLFDVEDILRVGSTATLRANVFGVFDLGESLSENVTITVTGADQSEYNVAGAAVTVISSTQIAYQVTGAPATPATGADIEIAYTNVAPAIESVDFAEDANLVSLAGLKFESPLVGVNEDAQCGFSGVTGGADQETDSDLRARLLDRIQNPVAHFNVADIDAKAKTVPGVTRVFVFEITPAVGQVTIYFMRDDDAEGPIPSGFDVTEVKNKLNEIRPANTAEVDMIVLAPTAVPTNFDFASLSPNTSTMKTAVRANLKEFFDQRTTLGVNVTADEYRSAIFNTVDTTTGQILTSFSLNSPSGDIPIITGEIGTLGTFAGEI